MAKRKGWKGDRSGHQKASIKGWNKRFAKGKKYSYADIKKMNAARSRRGLIIDASKKAKFVKPGRYGQWVKNPNRYDIKGIDDFTLKLIKLNNQKKKKPTVGQQKLF